MVTDVDVTRVRRSTPLPSPRGELSATVTSLLRGERPTGLPSLATVDPYGEDLQLALHICYELHYHGFESVDPDLEWDLEVLRIRAALEDRFLAALRADSGSGDLDDELERLTTVPAYDTGVGSHLRDAGEWWQVQEYFVHRSIYHLKEADPYAWVIPRLRGTAKAALVAVEFDEFGGGRGDRVHAQLFADLMDDSGLRSDYLYYLDVVPAPMLALVNMMSLFGLHRTLRGALVGHFAMVEITSPPASRRMVETLRRFDAAPACVRFYTEHVEADAVHEQVLRRDVIGDLLIQEPELREDMTFGIRATALLENRVDEHMLDHSWLRGRSSLHEPGLRLADGGDS